jgi:hypothetical protein
MVRIPMRSAPVYLDAWGRAPDGWYGHVWWREYGRREWPTTERCCGWLAAAQLQPAGDRPATTADAGIPRLTLDGRTWPTPADLFGDQNAVHDFGLIATGQRLTVPGLDPIRYAAQPSVENGH